jgi:hypothetical protein
MGPFPAMGEVLIEWQNSMLFKKIVDEIINFEDIKTESDYPFRGVFQPMSPRELFFKTEGERNWRWWKMWTKPGLDIQNGDIIEDFKGVRFKIVKSSDWNQGGYSEYDLLEDYLEHT